MYNARGEARPSEFKFERLTHNPPRKLYKPCFIEEKTGEEEYGVFGSSLNFLNDLIWLGYYLMKVQDRKSALSHHLQ